MIKECIICGKVFDGANASKTCSKECSNIRKSQTDKLKRIKERACKSCGKKYVGTKMFCSDECKHNSLVRDKKSYSHTCVTCGTEYKNKQYHSKYCSNECKPITVYKSICKQCGRTYNAKYKKQIFCSVDCLGEHNRKRAKVICQHCGELFNNTDNRVDRKFCSRDCFLKHIGGKKWDQKSIVSDATHIKRAKKLNVKYESIDPIEIFNRDNWTCGLCGKAVNKYTPYPDDMSASLDHIKPLSKGGTHTKDNVQLAHLGCNRRKGNKLK